MKIKFIIALVFFCAFQSLKAQFVFNEPFFNLASINANLWGVINNSGPAVGTTSWFVPGTTTVFGAHVAPNTTEYVGANFNSVANTGTISTWLLSPIMPMVDGTTFSFWTRTRTRTGPTFPDRLELRLSTSDVLSDPGVGAASVGTYSILLNTVNPGLTTTGYPDTWTQYTATLTGVPTLTWCGVGFRYFVTNGGPGATAVNSDYIGVDELQIVTPCTSVQITPTSATICPGQSVTLEAKNSPFYSWAHNSSTLEAVSVSPTVTTTYTVAGIFPGCPNTLAQVTVHVPTPTLNITANPPVICSPGSTSLTATGGTSYTWTPSATLSGISGANATASPPSNTSYVITGSNGICTNTAAITVSVVTTPTVVVVPTSTTICSGNSAALTASGGTTYTWTASAGANPASSANVNVNPTSNTTYTVVSGPGTCTSQAVVTVSVAPPISITASPNTATFCIGGTGVNIAAGGGTSYTWSPASGLNTTTGANVIASPANTTTYTVAGSDGICTSTNTVVITAAAVNPTVNASSTNYCLGGNPVTLTANGATSYTWAPGTNLSSTTGAVVTASPQASVTYTLIGGIGQCTSSRTITINVIPITTVNVTSSGTLICIGGSGTTLSGNGAQTYTWTPGGQTTQNVSVNPTTTTTYSVIGQTALGCITAPGVIIVSVNPPMNPNITASSPTVCSTKTVALSVTPSGPGYSYTWTPVAQIQGASNSATIIAKPTNTGNIVYTVNVSNGICSETATFTLQSVSCIPPTANFTTVTSNSICTGNCITFTATATGGQPMTYQWFFPGGTPSSATSINPEVCYNASGDYTVGLIATNNFGSDTIVRNNFINVADTPAVVLAFGDTLIKIGQTAPISASGADFYSWSPNNGSVACPTCSNTVAQPITTTQYIVTGYNSPNCFRTDTIIVEVDNTCGDFFVPNAFSPNGDGLNETVNVHGFCIKTFNLQIFNRWGEKVFETTSKTLGWDGTYKGKAMDTGVFVYKADGITLEGKPFSIKGNITLIR